MLTRIRIETFNHDLGDVERELDEFELVLLRHELEMTAVLNEGQTLKAALGRDWELPERGDPDVEDIGGPNDPLGLKQEIAQAIALFDRLGEGAITRHLTEQVIEASKDGDGWKARRVVRYDGGIYSEES